MAVDWTTLVGFGVLITVMWFFYRSLREDNKALREEFRLLREDVSKLSDKIDKQGEAIVELQVAVAKLQAQMDAFEQRMAQSESRSDRMSESQRAIERVLTGLAVRINTSLPEIDVLRAEQEALEAEEQAVN